MVTQDFVRGRRRSHHGQYRLLARGAAVGSQLDRQGDRDLVQVHGQERRGAEPVMISGLTNKYQHKIKTADELAAILGPMPREKKVIMCHGVFDVVHPGHLRHLIYAKSKADILVTSITADVHISKGEYRPHVPQDLRALNLAAFELVDYVVIDQNATPLENLRKIQPNFFAKGYEYN